MRFLTPDPPMTPNSSPFHKNRLFGYNDVKLFNKLSKYTKRRNASNVKVFDQYLIFFFLLENCHLL